MIRRLPPLNSLFAFEASARLGSFTRAGEELSVTSAAVGQQVRGLEERLEIKLFHRSLEGLTLTNEARMALPQIRRGFDFLHQGVQTLVSISDQNRLSISVPPTFAMKWLVPRLHQFYEQHPQAEVRFDTSLRYVDVENGEVDLAVRFGPGSYTGLHSTRLIDEFILPVCSPILCKGKEGLRNLVDLYRFTLLHVEGETSDQNWVDWPQWGEKYNLDSQKLQEGPRFTQTGMTMQAAMEGQGIALCGVSYVLDEIVAGSLVAPFGTDCSIKVHHGYDLVNSRTRSETLPMLRFSKWIKQSARETSKLMERYLSNNGKPVNTT